VEVDASSHCTATWYASWVVVSHSVSVARRVRLSVLAVVTLLAFAAQAEPPAPPPKPVRPAGRPPKEPPAPPLPEPEIRFRVIAHSEEGPWTMRLENEGTRWLRVPADVRLIHLSVDGGDTMAKRPPKPVPCTVPPGLRLDAFPDRSALVLGPGDAYVETFDPRLFCFDKAAKALEGGAIVRARYGWEPPGSSTGRAKKVDPPFAVEGTVFPAAVQPLKQLVAPTLLLSWLPPDVEEAPHDPATPDDQDADDAEGHEGSPGYGAEPGSAGRSPIVNPGHGAEPATVRAPVDENAPRLEVEASPYVDALNAYKVSMTLTVTNVGHRPALAAIRPRMAAFHVDGPDGSVHCHASPPTRGLPRSAYQTLKPGASTAVTLLVQEACANDLFRRPGLYQVSTSLHLNEDGSEAGLTALTGVIHAPHATLVRIAEGPEPFAKKPPEAVRAAPPAASAGTPSPPAEGDADGGS
jgi:hypothetical protein